MHGKKPTREQRKTLTGLGLTCSDWLVQKNTADLLQLVNRYSGKVRAYRKSADAYTLVSIK